METRGVILRLFVYGTLAPGRSNAHILAPLSGQWEPATVRGQLYPDGWGAAQGYPGLVLDDQGDEVDGLIFSSDELRAHWARLDLFEGEGYRRVSARARRADGSVVDVQVYALSGHDGNGMTRDRN